MALGEVLKEFAITLGLDVESASFQGGISLVRTLSASLTKVASEGARMAANALRALPSLVLNVANEFDALDEASQKTGVGVEALQELAYAAKFSGLGLGDLEGSMGFLSKAMRTASEGGKDAKAAFKSLGVAFKDSNGQLRAGDSVLMDLADRFAQMKDGAEKAALARELFGRSGSQIIPMLNAGSAGIAKQRAEGRENGAVRSADDIKAGVAAADAVTKLSACRRPSISVERWPRPLRGSALLAGA